MWRELSINLCFVASGGCLFAAASSVTGWLPFLGSILSTLISLWLSMRARGSSRRA